MENGQAEIVVKLLASGRYVWQIGIVSPTENKDDIIQTIKQIDQKLRDEFPEYAKRGSGRSVDLEE